MTIIEQLARELNRPAEHIENVVRLLDEGNTIPFIARYRKELHGSPCARSRSVLPICVISPNARRALRRASPSRRS